MKVTAVYRYERQPDGGAAWIVELVEEPRCHTFGRTLRAAQRNIREAAAAWYEVEPSQVEVDDDVRLPPPASRAPGRSRSRRARERPRARVAGGGRRTSRPGPLPPQRWRRCGTSG